MTTPNTEPRPAATDAEISRWHEVAAEARNRQAIEVPNRFIAMDIRLTGLLELLARIKQEREMRRELARVLKSAIGHCDCADYNNKALFPCTDDRPCAGCYMTRTADALLSRAAKMEADYGK